MLAIKLSKNIALGNIPVKSIKSFKFFRSESIPSLIPGSRRLASAPSTDAPVARSASSDRELDMSRTKRNVKGGDVAACSQRTCDGPVGSRLQLPFPPGAVGGGVAATPPMRSTRAQRAPGIGAGQRGGTNYTVLYVSATYGVVRGVTLSVEMWLPSSMLSK